MTTQLPKVAYLMNAYPMTSTTFIRREIEALEEMGLTIRKFAVREWSGKLVDQRDILERERTVYLLTNGVTALFLAFFLTLISDPMRLARAVPVWVQLVRNAGGQYVKHLAYFMQAARFVRLSRNEGVEHVHVHFATNATAVALLAHLMGGPTYSFTVHGPDELLLPRELSFSCKAEHAAFVVAISEFCRDFLERHLSGDCRQKIVVARCGLALEEFDNNEIEMKANRTLVCVGRLCPQKGQLLIPVAAAQLRDEFPDLKIILIGDGEIRQELESRIKEHKVEGIVELRGWVENRSVLEIVKSARALLLPSFAEGLPVVIMEAFALGTPVITTTIAGIPELVDQDCGWLFPAGDQAQLLEAMRAALACPTGVLKSMSQAGRDRVIRLHDRKKLAQILYERFSSIVALQRGLVTHGDRPKAPMVRAS